MTDEQIIEAMRAATVKCTLGQGWEDRWMAATFAVAKPLIQEQALREAAEVAKTCGNGKLEEWDPWETGFLFARKDIEAAILKLIPEKPASISALQAEIDANG